MVFIYLSVLAIVAMICESETIASPSIRTSNNKGVAKNTITEPTVRLVPMKSVKSPNAKGPSAKKSNFRTATRVRKLAPALARKVAIKKELTTSLKSDAAIVPAYLFSMTGERSEKIFNGLRVGNQMLIVRLDNSLNFVDLLTDFRLYTLGADRSYVELSLISVNFEKKIALMRMTKPQVGADLFRWPSNISPHVAGKFELNSSAEFMTVINQFEIDLNEQSRKTASINRSQAAVIESKLMIRAQKIVNEFISSTEPLRLGKVVLATKPFGTRCKHRSPEISIVRLQQQISNAQSVNCVWSDELAISPQVRQFFEISSGLLSLKNAVSASDEDKMQLLQQLAAKEEKELLQDSSSVQYSSPSVCEKVILTDKKIELYYCTRSFKQFTQLSDSIVMIGTLKGNDYLYTLVRASGFTGEMNQNISNKLLASWDKNL